MKVKTLFFIIVAVIVVLIVLKAFLFTVDETEQAVVIQFGKPVRVILGSQSKEMVAALKKKYEKEGIAVDTSGAGLKFKLPFVQSVRKFDDRLLEYDDVPRRCPTKDKKFIVIDNFARWRIEDPLKFMKTVQNENGAQTRLDDIIYSFLREEVGSQNLYEIVRTTNRQIKSTEAEAAGEQVEIEEIKVGREKIMNEVTKQSAEAVKDYSIRIYDVRIKRTDLPAEIKDDVLTRMISERARIASLYRAEGEGESLRILGDKEKKVKTILSGAYRKAKEIEGKADAEAVKIYAEAFSKDEDFYKFLKTLETYKNSFRKGTRFITTTDSEYFKLFKEIEKVE